MEKLFPYHLMHYPHTLLLKKNIRIQKLASLQFPEKKISIFWYDIFSVFHSDHAEVLGLTLRKGRKIFFTVGNGEKIPGYIHKISVRFAGKEFLAEAAFSSSLGVGTNLLGLASFF